jgi:hypothetical protein
MIPASLDASWICFTTMRRSGVFAVFTPRLAPRFARRTFLDVLDHLRREGSGQKDECTDATGR